MNNETENTNENRWTTMGMFGKFLVAALFLVIPVVQAVDLDTTITNEEKAQFDQILTPVMKIYNFIKYAASAFGVIALLGAGIMFMFAGNDIRQRDVAKHTASFAIIGLAVIWAAPYVVDVLIS